MYGSGAGLGTAGRAMVVACVAAALVAPACKGGRKAAKGAAGGPGGAGAHILVESGTPDRDCIYDAIVGATDDSALADTVYEELGGRFEAPSVLASLADAQAAEDLLAAIRDAGCEVGTARVVSGKIDWKLEVIDQGNGANCMIDTLKGLFPGTSDKDWSSRVGQGQLILVGTDPVEIEMTRSSLEKKCGCRLKKYYVER